MELASGTANPLTMRCAAAADTARNTARVLSAAGVAFSVTRIYVYALRPEHLISASGGARPRSHHGEKRGMGGSARNTLRCLPGSVSGGSGRLQGRRRSPSPRVGMGTASATQRATYAFVAFCARLLKPADGLVKRTALRRFAAGALTCVSRPRAGME